MRMLATTNIGKVYVHASADLASYRRYASRDQFPHCMATLPYQ